MPLLKISGDGGRPSSDESGPFWNPDTKAGLVMGASLGAALPSITNAVAAKVVGDAMGVDAKKLRRTLDGLSMNDVLDILGEGHSDLFRAQSVVDRAARKPLPGRLAARASWMIPAMLTTGASGTFYGRMRAGDENADRSFWGDVTRDSGKWAALGGVSYTLPLLSMVDRGSAHMAYMDPVDVYREIFRKGRGVDVEAKRAAWRSDGKVKRALKVALNVGKFAVPGAAVGGLSAMAQNAVHHGLRNLFDDGDGK